MQVECLAIIFVIAVMSYMFSRAGKRIYGYAILPLTIVPIVHLLSLPVGQWIADFSHIHQNVAQVFIDVIGLVIACVLFTVICNNIKNRKIRRSYLVICGAFSIILTFVFIYDLLVIV